MEQTKDIFGKRLFEIRESRGESQQELADSIGITRQSLSRYELGERTANIDLLKKIAEHYNVSTDYLLGLTENATTDTDLQDVCKYTGLSEGAIKNLHEIDKFILRYLTNEESGDAYPVNKILDVLSEAIENDFLLIFAASVASLFDKSNMWTIKSIEYILNYGENAHVYMYNELYKECDLLRFNIIQEVSKFLEDKDCRFCVEYHAVTLESTFNKLKKQFLEEKGKGNGKHNPPKE